MIRLDVDKKIKYKFKFKFKFKCVYWQRGNHSVVHSRWSIHIQIYVQHKKYISCMLGQWNQEWNRPTPALLQNEHLEIRLRSRESRGQETLLGLCAPFLINTFIFIGCMAGLIPSKHVSASQNWATTGQMRGAWDQSRSSHGHQWHVRGIGLRMI